MERKQGIKMIATSNGRAGWRMQLPASCAPASSQGAMKIISKRLLKPQSVLAPGCGCRGSESGLSNPCEMVTDYDAQYLTKLPLQCLSDRDAEGMPARLLRGPSSCPH